MPLPTDPKALTLSRDLLQAFDNVNGGEHQGFRPAHAKGVMLTGTFHPSADAASLSRAPHLRGDSPVIVRFSDFAGIPTIPEHAAWESFHSFALCLSSISRTNWRN